MKRTTILALVCGLLCGLLGAATSRSHDAAGAGKVETTLVCQGAGAPIEAIPAASGSCEESDR